MNKEKAMWVVDQLNEVRIYPHGLYGKFKRFRHALKICSRSGFFENFMTICVTVNTITLGIDRYNIPEDQ